MKRNIIATSVIATLLLLFIVPTKSAAQMLQKSLYARRQVLLKRLSNHLKRHASEFASYNPEKDVLQRCSINGGYVQIR